ncbi:MAG: nucleoside-triphosphatase [Bacteroidales bacterium]
MNNKTFIISGTQGSGKTTFLKSIVDELSASGLRVGGFLALGYWKDNLRDRFDLIDLKSGDRLVYCQRNQVPGWEQVRHFYINPEAIVFGEEVLNPSILSDVDLIVIDEIGPFELAGKGWARSFDQILRKTKLSIIISVRESLLNQVIKHWKLDVGTNFQIPGCHPKKAAIEVFNALKPF